METMSQMNPLLLATIVWGLDLGAVPQLFCADISAEGNLVYYVP